MPEHEHNSIAVVFSIAATRQDKQVRQIRGRHGNYRTYNKCPISGIIIIYICTYCRLICRYSAVVYNSTARHKWHKWHKWHNDRLDRLVSSKKNKGEGIDKTHATHYTHTSTTEASCER